MRGVTVTQRDMCLRRRRPAHAHASFISTTTAVETVNDRDSEAHAHAQRDAPTLTLILLGQLRPGPDLKLVYPQRASQNYSFNQETHSTVEHPVLIHVTSVTHT